MSFRVLDYSKFDRETQEAYDHELATEGTVHWPHTAHEPDEDGNRHRQELELPPGLALYAYAAYSQIGKDSDGLPMLSERQLYCIEQGHDWAMRQYLERIWSAIAAERVVAKEIAFERARQGGDG